MAISYPHNPPSSPGFQNVVFSAKNVVSMVESPFTLARQVYKWPGERWEAEVTLPPLTQAQAAQWKAWLVALEGVRGTFKLGSPDSKDPQGVATGTPVVNGGSQTGNSLVTDGWTTGQTGIMKAGDMIELNNNLYMVTEDVNSDGSGNATLSVWPALRFSPSDNATITVGDGTNPPEGTFKLDANTIAWQENVHGYVQLSFSALEAFVTS